ncbi:TRAP transporter large permease subunit [Thalassospiraceae bacterium LMO-JJ14]|nr:TRAP transporter large permease subunit [Thalassospiraceae bacterium LMO-JJ14]
MELLFLLILIIIMISALGSGFPVAFALPGSAIVTISLAAASGYLFEGNVAAYFAHGDPGQWLTAGVTNFRGIYWEPERDTLIAIPLFIFMGIMLERSKIAEDLLVTMGQLFGPIPGGIGISVVIVGALLAATTGIVGATVVAMGLISLPVMLRANYSHALATGTIAASGTLGQIIPPSIVLIILADQLSNATDQALAIRTADYKAGTGQFTLPSEFGITSTSAGDMFLGAFLPGLVLVGLYIVYILVIAFFRPKMAPPAPHLGEYNRQFWVKVALVLVPPLALIFAVLGSIIMGIATVNQAGAIGAAGALIMAGYRLCEGRKDQYLPAMLAIVSFCVLIFAVNSYDINVKNIQTSEDVLAIWIASIGALGMTGSIVWSAVRVNKIDSTLTGVMIETAKTTSLVFIILLGAAMLTASFRAFGGEEIVKDFLSGLPGGFVTKFVVVMTVIFVLGFFLDFIEIAVVVVPIIAPLLLADPTANVTAVWLGVMIGVNMQTSFLTPPFGFALFYLRGVAPVQVRTISMYKGVIPFILLQLMGLAIVGFYPPLVNYLPSRIYLTSETAPPPANPRLQACLQDYLFPVYDARKDELMASINEARNMNMSALPDNLKTSLVSSIDAAAATFDHIAKVRAAEQARLDFVPQYLPQHAEARAIRVELEAHVRDIKKVQDEIDELRFVENADPQDTEDLKAEMEILVREKEELEGQTPVGWKDARKKYQDLEKAAKTAERMYQRNVDTAYEQLPKIREIIVSVDQLIPLRDEIAALSGVITGNPPEKAMDMIEIVEKKIGNVPGASKVKSPVSKARRKLRGDTPDPQAALKELEKALPAFDNEVAWRQQAKSDMLDDLQKYDAAIANTIGVRLQDRLSPEQAKDIASCLSVHRDISLSF